ncbi:MAG: BadF/BadG/BcrA/BcrD ATPase family protein [Candidatus Didemnitutus sp.]|nr:BadF/BadG/BcrA/BcrD ATPase family protein [Candidatus Didemnitutus sp.]
MNYHIGVDGGGTKTELILVDDAGRIVAQHAASGCNPSHVGPERARAVVGGALDALLAAAPAPFARNALVSTQFFMAGSPAFWREFAASLTDFGEVKTAPDSWPVLELATEGAPGLALHAGTGSFIVARDLDGKIHSAGGLGWKLGDPGSGFDMGRRAIARALLEMQGWGEPSVLSTELRAHTGLQDAPAITRYFYAEPAANVQIAAFAPRVLATAASGCLPAQTIVVASLGELVTQARFLTAKLFPAPAAPLACGLSGPILNHAVSVYALKAIAETNQWPVEFRFLTAPPIEGVHRLLLAAR